MTGNSTDGNQALRRDGCPDSDPGAQVSAIPAPEFLEKLRKVFRDGPLEARNTAEVQSQGMRFVVGDAFGWGPDSPPQTVVAHDAEGLRFPTFALQPRQSFQSFFIGMPDIDFPAHPDFSKAYFLCGENEKDVGRLFNDRVLAALGRLPGFRIESAGSSMAMLVPDQVLTGDALKGFATTAAGIFRLFDESARASGFTKERVLPKLNAALDVMGESRSEARRTFVSRTNAEARAHVSRV